MDFISEDIGTRRPTGPANRWKTSPLTSTFHESPKTSLLFAAQSRAYNAKQLTQNQSSSSSVRTPKLSRTNPFEDVSSLEYDRCSPGLFIVQPISESTEVISASNTPTFLFQNNEFRWSIEDISRIMPADIKSPNSASEECFDEETENAAQEAIEKYFSFRHAVLSPSDTYVQKLSSPQMNTPPELLMARTVMGCCRNSVTGYGSSGKGMNSAISSTPCARSAAERRLIIKVDESTQTRLSLPPILPPELEAALQPYMQNKDDNVESEDCNISNTTLRRKLFFKKDEESSPVKTERLKVSLSNSLLADNNSRPSRIDWTPDAKNEQNQLYCISSPDISPIKFKSSFEFSKDDMSIDCSSMLTNNDVPISCENTTKMLPSDSSLTSYERGLHSNVRAIFSSTTKSSHIDRSDKDTGYSTMEVDCSHAQLTNKT